MKIEDLEQEARFAAQNAEHNLRMVEQQAESIDRVKLNRNIKWLEMMIQLHEHDLAQAKEQQKKARLAGRTTLRSRLKSLLSSIVTLGRQKRKEGAV